MYLKNNIRIRKEIVQGTKKWHRGPTCDVLSCKYGGLLKYVQEKCDYNLLLQFVLQCNKCTGIKLVDNSILLNRLHTAMITVLDIGSNLLLEAGADPGMGRFGPSPPFDN